VLIVDQYVEGAHEQEKKMTTVTTIRKMSAIVKGFPFAGLDCAFEKVESSIPAFGKFSSRD
jgi:hypothetical protein